LADRVFQPVAQNADLPHALVPVTMTEDATGFLWLGGDGGLLRWDGYEFRDYPAEPTLPDGIADAEILWLHRDAQNGLWAGTKSNGLARYDPVQDRLVCFPLRQSGCDRMRVRRIDDDGDGGLWVGTSIGLFRVHRDGQIAGPWNARNSRLPDDIVNTVLHDRHDALWVGTSRGLVRSTDQGRTFVPVPLGSSFTRTEPPEIMELMEGSDGRVWIGTLKSGAYVAAAGTGPVQIQAVAATVPQAPGDMVPEISAMLEVAPGRIWLATLGSGIIEVDGATLHARSITHDPFVPNGLDRDSVQSLYRDRSGLVWVGTENGLSQYNPSTGIITIFGRQGRTDGLPGEGVEALRVASDGAVWAGLQGGVWAGLQGDSFVVLDPTRPTGRRRSGLPGKNVWAFAPGPAGGMLLGTDGGLFLADQNGKIAGDQPGSLAKPLAAPQFNAGLDVRALRTSNGAVWLGARRGGLWKLNIKPNGQVGVLQHWDKPELTNNDIDAVDGAPDNRIAVGTDDGFNLLDPATGRTEKIENDKENPHSLDAGLVSAFATDRHGRLWVGTTNGLDMMEGRDPHGKPKFRRFGLADGLPNASIDALLVDRAGKVWASTDMGLAVIDPESFSVRALQRADGLAITNYWADAAGMTQDGDLIFGGVGGLTVLRPEEALPWRYQPRVVFTEARIGGRPVPLNQGDSRTLVLPPEADSLAVEFAALDYSAPSRNHYRYRLDGFDTEWVVTDAAHRVAAYTNLPPGQYALRLRGSNRDGIWARNETSLDITVLPAWYQTLWFRLAAAAAAILVVVALLRGWTAILRRRQRELERQVADRTGELSASRLQLQHANAVLEMRVAERTQALVERTAALEASEARFRAWFNNAEDAVFVVQVEPDGHFVFEAVNAAVERIYGIAATSYRGRRPETVLPAPYAAEMLDRYREATKGTPIQFETRFASQQGERLVDTWIVPVRDPVSGRVERLVGASRDMTERRALEARLAQAQKLQALGGLAGGIAHDFNNILQAVAGAAVLIEQQPDNDEKTQRLARSTIAAAERGTSITRRLLAFARSDELRVEAMPTAEVLEGLAEVLTYSLGSTIDVRASFAEGLPPLLADRGQLETALVNLGTNARDAMPGGGVLELSAESEQVTEDTAHPAGLAPGSYVRIDVTDTGCGIDEATLSRVVEPFFTTKPPGQGTGLGLALVKGFTEQSGGGMAIESTPGVGTIVRLWLRQAPAGTVGRTVEPAGERAQGAAPARILVVDDDDLVRETMAEQLAGGGFNVVAAASGVEALAAISAATPPDALVCDLSMPGMNGIDTIKRVRDLLPGLPCFLLTGYAGERAALEGGQAFTLLRKPITARALIAQIDAGLAAGRR
jgi:PAS domain S-box-containing protein